MATQIKFYGESNNVKLESDNLNEDLNFERVEVKIEEGSDSEDKKIDSHGIQNFFSSLDDFQDQSNSDIEGNLNLFKKILPIYFHSCRFWDASDK